MINPEDSRGIEYYRRYFINPRSHTPDWFIGASSKLAENIPLSPNGPIAEHDEDAPEVETVINEMIADYALSRRFDHRSAAQLHPSDNLIAILAHFASTLRNNNTVIGDASPVETRYEREDITWLLQNIACFDLSHASGSLVTGGTSANHTALFVARERLVHEKGPAFRKYGAVVLANEMAHYSVHKSSMLLAPFDMIKVEHVPIESGSFRVDVEAMRSAVKRYTELGVPIMAIVGIAGETETGQIEDIASLAEIAEKYGIYFHIDGAYGAPFRISRIGSSLSAMSDGDSLTCDPHKYLYLPYNSGAILFRNAADHSLVARLNGEGKEYLFQELGDAHHFKKESENHLGLQRIEGSVGGQSASALYWTLRVLGEQGLRTILNHTLDMATVFHEEIVRQNVLHPVFAPELNTVCLSPTSTNEYPLEWDQLMVDTVGLLEKETGIYVTTTTIPLETSTGERSPRKVFRIVATHPHTSENDMREVAVELSKRWGHTVKP